MKPSVNAFMIRLVSLCTLLALLAPVEGFAWGDGKWASRTKIHLDTTAKGLALQAGVPQAVVLVRLDLGNFAFDQAKPGGADIRFVASDDKTALKYQIESFDDVNNLAVIWVQLPELKPGTDADYFWMYYGNPNVDGADDGKALFDANQTAVFHFSEKDGLPRDATSYRNNAAQFNGARNTGSLIGSGLRFDGKASMSIPAGPSMQYGGEKELTFTAWLKPQRPQQAELLALKTAGGASFVVGIDQSALYAGLSGRPATPRTAQLAPGAWHHVAVTVDKRIVVFVDGKELASVDGALPAMEAEAEIGRGYVGEIDEVGLANIARSADWIKLAAGGQGPDAHLLSLGEAAGEEGGSTSYFGTILRSVTTDGWVVIGLLVVMAGISWVVMIGKAMLLRRTEADNREFLEAFHTLGHTLGAKDGGRADVAAGAGDQHEMASLIALAGKDDHFPHSTLYRIYHTGVHEVKSRLSGSMAANGLTTQAVDAIRAKLDGTLVRQNQKLNDLMVLLTIAISGGPFLGLLGTVVGVMITFAAIAATGDVNVAAIAPGIAAALVATVAGLAVAIPALFGYNYLGSRIKAISADMHVFVDELVSRIAETHSA